MIIKRSSIGSLDATADKKIISYCERCEEFGLRRVLGERIYKPEELERFGGIPSDHESWRQCHYCGTIYPKYATKEESVIEPFVTVSENPHDALKAKMSGIEQRGGQRGTIHSKERKKEQYKDPEINAAVRKGAKVLGYSET